MAALQQASMLKAIVLSHSLSNYRDLFNLCHLVHRWCTAPPIPSSFPAAKSQWPWRMWQTNCCCPFLAMWTQVLWNSLPRRRPWRPSWRKGWAATRSCRIRLGLSPRLLMQFTARPLLCFRCVSHLWLSPSLCRKPSLFPISHKDICRGESAICPYVSGSSVYAIRRLAKWWEVGGFLPYSHHFDP